MIVHNPHNRKLIFVCVTCGKEVNPKNITRGHEQCVEYNFEGSSMDIDWLVSHK
jgi:hypothetical protein